MLAVRVLEGAAGLLPQQAPPRSGGSSGPTREVNFQQEAIDFTGPKTIADLRSDPITKCTTLGWYLLYENGQVVIERYPWSAVQ